MSLASWLAAAARLQGLADRRIYGNEAVSVRSLIVSGLTLTLAACSPVSGPSPLTPSPGVVKASPSRSLSPTPSAAVQGCRVPVDGTEAAVVVVGPTALQDCRFVVSAVLLPSGRKWAAIQEVAAEIPQAAGAACSQTQGSSTLVVLDTPPQELGKAICSKLGVIFQH